DHAIAEAEKINVKAENFALISDLTNTIQIGDLLILEDNNLFIRELKEGKVNEKLRKMIDSDIVESSNGLKELKFEITSKEKQQIERMLRQERRAIHAVEVINTDVGV